MSVTVYCSGSIQKGASDSKKLCWTEIERIALAAAASPVAVHFLNPDDPSDALHDTEAMFGRDMYQVQFADYVVVDARERRGIGIGIEMLAAKVFGTHVIAVAPRNTYYRMDKVSYRGSSVDDYIHPHLAILADGIVDTFEDAGRWIGERVKRPKRAKTIGEIYRAIEAYTSRALERDEPMLSLIDKLTEMKTDRR